MRGSSLKNLADPLIVQPVAVHCGKQADAANLRLRKSTVETGADLPRRGIEHQEADETAGVAANGSRHRCFIPRYACYKAGARYAVTVQLVSPAVGQHFWIAGILPAEPAGYCRSPSLRRQSKQVLRQQFEEARREEMTVNVAKGHGRGAIIVGLVSDTHSLVRQSVFAALEGVGLILHAGDVGGDAVLDALSAIAPVRAVRGNVDEDNPRLEPHIRLDLRGVSIHVSHGHELGVPSPAGLLQRYDADVLVYGHTHKALIHREEGRLVVNPGAAGPLRFDLKPSVARLKITQGHAEVEIVWLEG